jgi:hypothetical protein
MLQGGVFLLKLSDGEMSPRNGGGDRRSGRYQGACGLYNLRSTPDFRAAVGSSILCDHAIDLGSFLADARKVTDPN